MAAHVFYVTKSIIVAFECCTGFHTGGGGGEGGEIPPLREISPRNFF